MILWVFRFKVTVAVVGLLFTTLLTSQVISVSLYSEREKSHKFCSEALISACCSFTCRKSTTRDPRRYFPSEGSHTQDYYALKKSIDPRPGLNPRTSDPAASTITTGPPGYISTCQQYNSDQLESLFAFNSLTERVSFGVVIRVQWHMYRNDEWRGMSQSVIQNCMPALAKRCLGPHAWIYPAHLIPMQLTHAREIWYVPVRNKHLEITLEGKYTKAYKKLP